MNTQRYEYFDIHTHNNKHNLTNNNNFFSIQNISTKKEIENCVFNAYYFSYGIHPYNVQEYHDRWLNIDFQNKKLLALGEIGLDARYPNMQKQIIIFSKQLEIAKNYNLPVILHSVKTIPQTLKIVQQYKIKQFIFHGFNSSLLNAQKILDQGGAISFGCNLLYNKSLQKIIADVFQQYPSKIFFETDDSVCCISKIYHQATRTLNINLSHLQNIIKQNFNLYFQ